MTVQNNLLTSTTRLTFLDNLRGIAVLLVLAQHTLERSWPAFASFSSTWCNLGRTGVALFFIISGFIIPVSLEKKKSIKDFWINRFFRLYPLYWASIAAYIILNIIGLYSFPKEFDSNLVRHLLANFSMFERFLGSSYISNSYWTLTYELLFYIACSVLFVISSNASFYFFSWILVAIATVAIFINSNSDIFNIPFWLLLMFSGNALNAFTKSKITLFQVSTLIFSILGQMFFLALTKTTIMRVEGYENTPQSLILPWLISYMLFCTFMSYEQLNRESYLSWIGKVSYSMYLLQGVVIVLVYHLCMDVKVLNQFAALLVTFVVTFFCSGFSYKYIELPSVAFSRRFQKRVTTPRNA